MQCAPRRRSLAILAGSHQGKTLFASSPEFAPTEVVRFVRHFDSGAGAMRVVTDPDDITRLVCMDTWLRNPDRHGPGENRVNLDNVFFSMETDSDKVQLKTMDFTHAFTNGRDLTRRAKDIDNIREKEVYGLFPEFRASLSRNVVRWFCEQLASRPTNLATVAVGLIPKEWEVEPEARTSLIQFVDLRANFLIDSLEDLLFDPEQHNLPGIEEDKR